MNKIDLVEPEQIQETVAAFAKIGLSVALISGLTGDGIPQLKDLLEEKLEELRRHDSQALHDTQVVEDTE